MLLRIRKPKKGDILILEDPNGELHTSTIDEVGDLLFDLLEQFPDDKADEAVRRETVPASEVEVINEIPKQTDTNGVPPIAGLLANPDNEQALESAISSGLGYIQGLSKKKRRRR